MHATEKKSSLDQTRKLTHFGIQFKCKLITYIQKKNLRTTRKKNFKKNFKKTQFFISHSLCTYKEPHTESILSIMRLAFLFIIFFK